MENLRPYLKTREDDTKFIRAALNEDNLWFIMNVQSHDLEVWYKPPHDRGYKITTAEDKSHAVRQLRELLKFEQGRAEDLMKEIDEHNEKLVRDKEKDAMSEVKHDLKNILAGKKHFVMANMQARRNNAYI